MPFKTNEVYIYSIQDNGNVAYHLDERIHYVAQLKNDNSDLPIKTLVNNAQKLFGMSLGDYLKEIGVLG